MPGMSPPMSLKGDPDMHLKKVLSKYKLDRLLPEIQGWLDMEPGSPGHLKKLFITTFFTEFGQPTNQHNIDLKDPTTWGEPTDESMIDQFGERGIPDDQFFLDMYKAIKLDEKRRAKRSSYEF